MDEAAATTVPLARVRHPLRVVAFAAAALLLLASAFVAGHLVRAPGSDALESAQEQVVVEVAVEERTVSSAVAVPASFVPGANVEITVVEASVEAAATAVPEPAAADGATTRPIGSTAVLEHPTADRVAVTASPLQAGTRLGYGTLVAEVSGRPLFAVPTTLPLYRDLVLGAKGSDVAALQQLLVDLDFYGVEVTGRLDTGTLAAAGRLYATAGYDLPYVVDGTRGIAWREFLPTPTGDGLVVSRATVGTELDESTPVLVLAVSSATIGARITALERASFPTGALVDVSVNGAAPVQSTVLSIGEFQTDEQTGASGYPIAVAIPEGLAVEEASTIQVASVDATPAGPAIPAIAIRQEAGATYVVLPNPTTDDPSPSPSASQERIEVTITGQSDGWVAIEPDERLPVGARIVVQP